MTKKIIAVIVIVTVLFVSVFAACNKKSDDGVYVKNKDINFVTDENGNKVLSDDGELLVYATDEHGKRIKNANGEYETLIQEFQPIEDDGVVEDYGFTFTLPKGWKSTSEFGKFINSSKNQSVQINIVQFTYGDYYQYNKNFYDQMTSLSDDIRLNWEDNVDLGTGFNKVCRFTMTVEGQVSILYFFENSNNVYKVLFNAQNPEDLNTAISDSEAICKAMAFKPYTYYPDVTSSTAESTTQIK